MAIKVGILRGGPSNEHEVSLKTGENVIKYLPQKYSVYDIILGKSGNWFFNKKISLPDKILRSIDVVFNALHGEFGEDGKVQQILETFGVPYTGSGILSSALGMNKIFSSAIFAKVGLKIPEGIIIDKEKSLLETAKDIFKLKSPPWVVKPISCGSSVGVCVADTFDDLVRGIKDAFLYSNRIIIEEYIKGREMTCGVIDSFRGERYYALPVTEIILPPFCKFFDYNAKYKYETQEICPANIDLNIKKSIEEMAKTAHRSLGCRDYSRSDFMVAYKKRKPEIYILEINTLPGLTPASLLPKALSAVGSTYTEFLDHIIGLALNRKNNKK
ncbi:MAG: D-alanine--D-alanine ligase [Patescibacteria group bacterium]